jgi:hypothetical protein
MRYQWPPPGNGRWSELMTTNSLEFRGFGRAREGEMIPVYQNKTRALFKTDNSAVAAEFNAAITRGDDAFIEYEGKKYRVLSASDEEDDGIWSILVVPCDNPKKS